MSPLRELVLHRQRGPASLWKRVSDFPGNVSELNSRLPRQGDTVAEANWEALVRDLRKNRDVILTRVRFTPVATDDTTGASLLRVGGDHGRLAAAVRALGAGRGTADRMGARPSGLRLLDGTGGRRRRPGRYRMRRDHGYPSCTLVSTSASVRTPAELLDELRERGIASGTYSELEGALIEVMREHQSELPQSITARDVLVYARDHRLIAREGDRLIVQNDRS